MPLSKNLDPKEPTFFRLPSYDFLIYVLKKVGSLGLGRVITTLTGL